MKQIRNVKSIKFTDHSEDFLIDDAGEHVYTIDFFDKEKILINQGSLMAGKTSFASYGPEITGSFENVEKIKTNGLHVESIIFNIPMTCELSEKGKRWKLNCKEE